jgi:hypothetical protein
MHRSIPGFIRISSFFLTALVCVVTALSCTKKQSGSGTAEIQKLNPEQTVERFIELSASAKDAQDKLRLRDMCQGKLRQAFEKMSDENFRMNYLAGGISMEGFKIVSQKVEKGDAIVRYNVTIHNKNGPDVTQESNEREVALVQIDGIWYLDSIRPAGKDQVAFVNGIIF